MTVTTLPKIELHLHHEGAAPPWFIRDQAKRKNIDISGIFDEGGNYAYQGFLDFLRVYEAACTTLRSPQDFYLLTRAILEESAKHGVVYSETFLSPDFCGGGDLEAWRDYLGAIREAAEESERDLGITLRGIVTCVRHFGPEQARRSALCAAETAGDWLTGFGMGGDEGQYAPGDFAYAFDMAREAGLRLTAHAGEWGGPQSVRASVRELGVERVGHGVRAIEDAALVQELADRGVVLEVCPGSNVSLGVYRDWKSHPIAKLRKAGVPVTVSTDDPPFFHTSMTREYDQLSQTFGWEEDDFRELNRVALSAAFCDDATRARIAKILEPSDA